jgi:hypothetical protein
LHFRRKRYRALTGGADETARMQKLAIRRGWSFVVGATASMALTLLISVAGLELSAGVMGRGGPYVGDEPTSGLRGAEAGVSVSRGGSPGEHQG